MNWRFWHRQLPPVEPVIDAATLASQRETRLAVLYLARLRRQRSEIATITDELRRAREVNGFAELVLREGYGG